MLGYLRGQYWGLSRSFHISMISPVVLLTVFDYLLRTLPYLLSLIMTVKALSLTEYLNTIKKYKAIMIIDIVIL